MLDRRLAGGGTSGCRTTLGGEVLCCRRVTMGGELSGLMTGADDLSFCLPAGLEGDSFGRPLIAGSGAASGCGAAFDGWGFGSAVHRGAGFTWRAPCRGPVPTVG